MNISERIKVARVRLYSSQEAAARAADVTMNTWSRWERGAAVPELASLEKIAVALKMSLSELVSEKPAADAATEPADPGRIGDER